MHSKIKTMKKSYNTYSFNLNPSVLGADKLWDFPLDSKVGNIITDYYGF